MAQERSAHLDIDINTTEENIKDFEQVSGWAKDNMLQALEIGLIKGYNNNDIKPKNKLTRAETAALLNRFLLICANEKNKD